MASPRLAVDIGGTFTDLALEHDGHRTTLKVLTTPAAPDQGVLAGVRAILAATALAPSAVSLVIHGTTLATNAIIERKGARTALFTTAGFRDVLAMRNESRYDQYDLNLTLPEPLVPRRLRFTVPERIDNTGAVLAPLDEAAVGALLPKLAAEQVQSLAIGFLHSFVNPAHEIRVREIIAAARPDLAISLSSEVSPEMREWERFSTTVANAYVQPLMAGYLRRLESELHALGFTAPLFLMLSGGGLTTIETACRFPIRLVESGPAGGAIFAAHIARAAAMPRVLSFDMGGTTAKICLIDDFRPETAKSFEVARVGRFRKGSGMPLSIPVIQMVEIGAGGGSLARVDAMGRIAVGPESAGADPGPACYAQGGLAPAVTDANLLLGRYDAAHFAGGKLRLDRTAAEGAVERAIARPLGLSLDLAALGIVEMVDETMANAARMHAAESGKTYAGRTIIAFGGGGPVHACRLADKLGITRVLVPSGAGVGSAIGFLEAPIAYELVRSLYQRLASFDANAVNDLLRAMTAEAHSLVAAASPGASTTETSLAFMRYVGQGHEIPVPLPALALAPGDIGALRTAYEAAYTRFFDRPVPGSEIEVLSFSVLVSTALRPAAALPPNLTRAPTLRESASRTRRVRDSATGEVADWATFFRAALLPGKPISGPALITEDETTTLVPAGWRAVLDQSGYLLLDKDRP
ncbi:MAG: hydantoinase/oxoprolinase family protein [Acetobacteraceae bacterium]